MEQKNKILNRESSLLVEALQSVHKAEDRCLRYFLTAYGDDYIGDTTETTGEKMYRESGLKKRVDLLKVVLKEQIGETLEMSFCGLFPQSITEEE